jgi:Domain of unknown function (DUF4157)
MALDRKQQTAAPAFERRRPGAAAIQRSAAPAPSAARTLQERLGNHGTQAFIQFSKASRLPAKVSKKTDAAELEAEETARKVMRMREPPATKPTGSKPKTTGVVQRAEAGTPAPAPAAARGPSRVNIAGGSPLPSPVRGYMEPRFGASFSNVRVHTGAAAAQQSARLNANAFTVGDHVFFGRDKYQPQSASGRELIAHELAHTVQQGATIQRSEAPAVAIRSEPRVQRWSISDGLDWIARKAHFIPGFRLLTIVLGMNPINWEPVDRSTANILRGMLELVPVTGPLVVQALDNYKIIDKVAAWAEGKIKSLGMVGSAIKRGLDEFLDSLSWTDIFDLDDVYERGKRIFTDPIDQLIDLGVSIVSDILEFIRQAILEPLAALAEGTDGYDLLKAVLKEDPVTGEPYPRTPETVIGGFMKLIGQSEIWENAKRANAAARAWAWFESALQDLWGFVSQIPTLFIDTLKSLEITDLLLPPLAFIKVGKAFGKFLGQFISWAGNAMWNLLEIIFDVVSPGAFAYVKKTGAALKSILQNPIPFVKNLVKAAKLGFMNFAGRFFDHLKAGLIEWLTGALPGVYIPKGFTLVEIAKFAFSVLGLTWANIRQKLVKAIGETAVKALETGFDIVVTLVRDGPAAAWDKIQEQLADLKDMVIGGIIDMIIGIVTKKAIPKLLAMFIPGAGFISAILSIYDTVMVFVQRLAKIIQVVKSFVDSIVSIANGAIDAAATRVENTLAGLLSLAINFLAGFAGLGNVAEKVMEVIQKVRAPIDKALDWLVGWIVKAGKFLWGKAKAGAAAIGNWWKQKLGFTNAAGETHTLQFTGSEKAPKLAVASTVMPVRQYLDTHASKDSKDANEVKAWRTADATEKAVTPVVHSYAMTPDDKKNAKTMQDALAKMSAALAALGGGELPVHPKDYIENAPVDFGKNPVVAEYMAVKVTGGSGTGDFPRHLPGWDQIPEELTNQSKTPDKWVQMHILSAELGGSGTNVGNLVPAPNSVNSGPFRSFERSTISLVAGKSGKVQNLVWAEVSVTGPKHAATALAARAGLHLWKGKGKSANKKDWWFKDPTPQFSASARIPPVPDPKNKKLSLNFTGSTEMKQFGIDKRISDKIKMGRYYSSEADFRAKMAGKLEPAEINFVAGKQPLYD